MLRADYGADFDAQGSTKLPTIATSGSLDQDGAMLRTFQLYLARGTYFPVSLALTNPTHGLRIVQHPGAELEDFVAGIGWNNRTMWRVRRFARRVSVKRWKS